MRNILCFALFSLLFVRQGRGQSHSKETILVQTNLGNLKIKLFEETPLHKANFLKLVREGVFDSLLFHRVINTFMIQGGDPLSKFAKPNDTLGHGDLGYMVPAEFKDKIIHKKGRLCAARESDEINPEMASSASQFYIVMGRKRTMEELKKYEERINKGYYAKCARAFLATEQGKELKKEYNSYKAANDSINAQNVNKSIEERVKREYEKKPEYKFGEYQIETYTKEGGTPHLDGTYTVFGEVIEGIEVIDKIAGVKTDKRDRPLVDVRMKIMLIEE